MHQDVDNAAELLGHYRKVFAGDSGKIVMQDLLDQADQFLVQQNPNVEFGKLMFDQGRRSMVSYIVSMASTEQDDIRRIAKYQEELRRSESNFIHDLKERTNNG